MERRILGRKQKIGPAFQTEADDHVMLEEEMGKRKAEENDTGLGDGKDICRATKERKAVKLARPSPRGDGEYSHKIIATIGPIVSDGEQNRPSEGGASICLSCDLKDTWTHKYATDKRKRRHITTGDHVIDRALPDLEFLGYALNQHILNGRFASVFHAFSQFHRREVAIKLLKSSAKKKLRRSPSPSASSSPPSGPWSQEIPDEVAVHTRLKHPRIIELLDYHFLNGQLCLILEFCENGNMGQLLSMRPSGFLSETISRRYFRDMVDVVEYLHHQCVVHRDIKCENFVLDQNDRVKLCDFGAAKLYTAGNKLFEDRIGSPGHHAPEILEQKQYNPRLADIWMLGISLFQMLSGKLPFGKGDSHDSLARISRGLKFPDHRVLRLSNDVKDLLKGILCYVPEYRYSINRIKNCPWYVQDDNKVSIGFYHLVRQPQKVKDSSRERGLKRALQI